MVKKVIKESWFIKAIWFWLYSSGGSKELWVWTFIHTSWTFQCVPKSLVFQIVGRSHWWSLYLRMLGKGLLPKITNMLVFFLWLVKSLKNLNNRIVDHLEKWGFFSDFQYGFRHSRSTADLLILIIVSERITRAFNRSGATPAVALDVSKSLWCWSSSKT